MMLNIFKSERTCGARELPILFRQTPIVRESVVSPEAQTLTNGEKFTVLLRNLKHLNVRFIIFVITLKKSSIEL